MFIVTSIISKNIILITEVRYINVLNMKSVFTVYNNNNDINIQQVLTLILAKIKSCFSF